MVVKLPALSVLVFTCLLLRALAGPQDDDSSVYSSTAPSGSGGDIDSLTGANSSTTTSSPPAEDLTSFVATGSGVDLLSSRDHILGVGNAILYALPISTKQLRSILTSAQEDLSIKSKTAPTSFYQWNHTNWSFEVVLAPGQTLRYGAIQHIVNSYLKKAPDPAVQNFTSTYVGRVDKGTVAVADVVFIPQDPGPEVNIAFTNTTAIGEAAEGEILVDTLTVDGSTLTREPYDPTALDFLNATAPTTPFPKRQMGELERHGFREIGVNGWMMSFRVLQAAGFDRPFIYKTSAIFMVAALGSAIDKLGILRVNNPLIAGRLAGGPLSFFGAPFQIAGVVIKFEARLRYIPPGKLSMEVVLQQLLLAIKEQLGLSDPRRKVPSVQGDIYVDVVGPGGQVQRTLAGDLNITVSEAPAVEIPDELR